MRADHRHAVEQRAPDFTTPPDSHRTFRPTSSQPHLWLLAMPDMDFTSHSILSLHLMLSGCSLKASRQQRVSALCGSFVLMLLSQSHHDFLLPNLASHPTKIEVCGGEEEREMSTRSSKGGIPNSVRISSVICLYGSFRRRYGKFSSSSCIFIRVKQLSSLPQHRCPVAFAAPNLSWLPTQGQLWESLCSSEPDVPFLGPLPAEHKTPPDQGISPGLRGRAGNSVLLICRASPLLFILAINITLLSEACCN